jgi:hypothetical protein
MGSSMGALHGECAAGIPSCRAGNSHWYMLADQKVSYAAGFVAAVDQSMNLKSNFMR